METHTRKRARTESGGFDNGDTSGASAQTSPQDPQFWFEDGNIILVTPHVSFKVYRGLLAEHSAVFHSMFDIAQGAQSAAEQVNGCPVVALDDSPDDLRELFRLIFPLNASPKLKRGDVDIDTLSAVIRLDHKYELTALCEEALGYLTSYYTTDFDTWTSKWNTSGWQPQPVHAIGAIALARITNTSSILPTAFYTCCTLSPHDLVRGYTSKYGVQHRLDDADLERCLQMRDALTHFNARLAVTLLCGSTSPRCPYAGAPARFRVCARTLTAVMERSAVVGAVPHALADTRVLDTWLDNIAGFDLGDAGMAQMQAAVGGSGLCQFCRAIVEEKDMELRREAWAYLPTALGIPVENWGASVSAS